MKYEFDEYQLSELLKNAAELGAMNLAVNHGLIKTKISKAEAYRRYSRRLIDNLINEHKLMPVKIKGKTLFDVVELELVCKTNLLFNRHLKTA